MTKRKFDSLNTIAKAYWCVRQVKHNVGELITVVDFDVKGNCVQIVYWEGDWQAFDPDGVDVLEVPFKPEEREV